VPSAGVQPAPDRLVFFDKLRVSKLFYDIFTGVVIGVVYCGFFLLERVLIS
jgi:hypothetical protein